jgi:hypothetical protein
MQLSPKQNASLVDFARNHYDHIEGPVIHHLMKNNIGRKTFASRKQNYQTQIYYFHMHVQFLYMTLI